MAAFEVTTQTLDALLKLEAEALGNALPSYFGIEMPRIVRPFATELPQLTLHVERMDSLFETEDNDFAHFEYQSDYVESVLPRCFLYDAALYQVQRRGRRTVVFYGPRVTRAPHQLELHSIRYTVHNVYLGERDGEAVLQRLQQQVAAGAPLGEHERLDLLFLPLMRQQRPFEAVTRQALGLAQALPREQQERIIGALLALAYHYSGQELIADLLEELMATNYEILDSYITRFVEQRLREREGEALERGMQRGLEQGLQQGLEQGLQRGREQGLQQGLDQGL